MKFTKVEISWHRLSKLLHHFTIYQSPSLWKAQSPETDSKPRLKNTFKQIPQSTSFFLLLQDNTQRSNVVLRFDVTASSRECSDDRWMWFVTTNYGVIVRRSASRLGPSSAGRSPDIQYRVPPVNAIKSLPPSSRRLCKSVTLLKHPRNWRHCLSLTASHPSERKHRPLIA